MAHSGLLRQRLAALRKEQDLLRMQMEPHRAGGQGPLMQQRAALSKARLAIVSSEICSLLSQLRKS